MTADRDLAQIVKDRIALLHQVVPGSIGEMMDFQLLSCDPEAGTYTLSCKTYPWMRNVAGTLHGGMCATIVDQAMGFISYCVKPGEGTAPTIQLQVSYHRPLIPGEDVLVNIQMVSVTRSLMSLRCDAALASSPEKLCISASGTYFYKSAK